MEDVIDARGQNPGIDERCRRTPLVAGWIVEFRRPDIGHKCLHNLFKNKKLRGVPRIDTWRGTGGVRVMAVRVRRGSQGIGVSLTYSLSVGT